MIGAKPDSVIDAPSLLPRHRRIVTSASWERFIIVESPCPELRPSHGCEPLVEKLVEADRRRAWRSCLVSLLKLEVQEALRLAQWTVNGLVQVLARSRLGSSPW